MTPLADHMSDMIRQDGPLSMDRYMTLCLTHPEHGYYTSRDPFGRDGDFTTAPEISQMFGELIGIWCVSAWQTMQVPDPFHLVEAGPGRGTLMADLLRAARIMPGFLEAARVHLVEISPALRDRQRSTLAGASASVDWHADFSTVPDGPALVIGNEFFDVLPVQQLQLTNNGWRERVVGVNGDGELSLGLSGSPVPEAVLPRWTKNAEIGEIAELGPARDACAQGLGQHIRRYGGAMLFIDYGYTRSGPGDTLQAVSRHQPVDILHRPGECDLTAHVDFAALEGRFAAEGLKTYGPISQSQFLAGMGLGERVDMLAKRGGARQRMKIAEAARRLAAGNEMGHLFKVLAVTHPEMAAPAPFAQMEAAGQ